MPTRYHNDVPPGFEGEPLLYMLTVFSLLSINLLALEWIWRLCWNMVENRLPLRHPGTAVRCILVGLLVGAVIRSGPDVICLTTWHDLTPSQRAGVLHFDAWMDAVAFIPFTVSWLITYVGGPMIVYQLKREPIPLHLWPTRDQAVRPLKIGVGVLIVAVAITFFR